MIPESKFVQLVDSLLKKTREKQFQWGNKGNNEYVLPLKSPDGMTRSWIHVRFASPPTETDYYEIRIVGIDEQEVSRWVVHEGDRGWDSLSELFFQIQRGFGPFRGILEDIENLIRE